MRSILLYNGSYYYIFIGNLSSVYWSFYLRISLWDFADGYEFLITCFNDVF